MQVHPHFIDTFGRLMGVKILTLLKSINLHRCLAIVILKRSFPLPLLTNVVEQIKKFMCLIWKMCVIWSNQIAHIVCKLAIDDSSVHNADFIVERFDMNPHLSDAKSIFTNIISVVYTRGGCKHSSKEKHPVNTPLMRGLKCRMQIAWIIYQAYREKWGSEIFIQQKSITMMGRRIILWKRTVNPLLLNYLERLFLVAIDYMSCKFNGFLMIEIG